jgi:CRISPR-associated endonuclease/helicase Cas3
MPAMIEFEAAFRALTDCSPMGWQSRLFDQLYSGRQIPVVCELPTGLGKTSIIPIWLLALARQAQDASIHLPRRLAYIVNRRTVVDQATDVVEQIRERINTPTDVRWLHHGTELQGLAVLLRSLAPGNGPVLAVSTLRGELADNKEWTADPARPAIIAGTIDMIGSKLLFSGYGDRRYWRAQHAGLIGHDTLIVHDEAHLTPAFGELLHRVAEVQRIAGEPRPVRVIDLSATSRVSEGPVLRLQPEDEQPDEPTASIVRERLDAEKSLRVHEVSEPEVVDKIVELARSHDGSAARVLVYVRSPEDAREVATKLPKEVRDEARNRVAVLTGTLRGHERDTLVRNHPVYRALLDRSTDVERTVYLVSTSAGEVGIDIDADHLICDLTTLDSMIQRLGRVNRRGGRERLSHVDVVPGAGEGDRNSEFERATRATRKILERWLGSQDSLDVSPRNLRALLDGLSDQERTAAFAPIPDVPPLTDILLDVWSLTGIVEQMPGRPEVEAYLHGITSDLPETYVAWRKEVIVLQQAAVEEDVLRDWFLACPIRAHERLRDRTDRVQKTLADLLKGHRKKANNLDFPVVVLNERGEARWSHLSHVSDKQREKEVEYRTIVLPVDARGLNRQGLLDANARDESLDAPLDVAEVEGGGSRRQRWLLLREGDTERYERLTTGEIVTTLPAGFVGEESISLEEPAEEAEGEGRSRFLLVAVERGDAALDNPETAKFDQTLADHTARIVDEMHRIADALGLESTAASLKDALVKAAEWHDRGKSRPVWQRYACNQEAGRPLAKSTKYLHGRALGGYRHELGSLLDAAEDGAIQSHAERDLILHLIAAHHGWARPHFEGRAHDRMRSTDANERAAVEVMRRFGQLQQRFGRWGLAWLESLLRCADIAASKPSAVPAPSVSQSIAAKV